MRTTCIIDNYNYQNFIGEAVESALNQSCHFDEIIIVDDGSSDGSADLIKERWGSIESVKTVFKANGGQLSAFNAGYEASSGDLICFLDADDVYERDYLEKTLNFLNKNPDCDFSFCAFTEFGSKNEVKSLYQNDRDLGITVVLANQSSAWIGSPTSTLAINRRVVGRILPYPYTDEWRSRADDVLVWGASLVGARKFFHATPLVRYRVHSENSWFGRNLTAVTRFKRDLATRRLFNHFRKKMGYDTNLAELAYKEFRTHPTPDCKMMKKYYGVIRDGVDSRRKRRKLYLKLLAHFIETWYRSRTA